MSARFTFKFKGDTKNLDNLQKQWKQKYQAQVGVIGKTSARNDDSGLTNADLLLIHEFGVISKNIPRRSVFDSLNIKQKLLVNEINKIVKYAILHNEPIYNVYFRIALVMLEICKEAFYTDGYGTWQPLSPQTIANKLKDVTPKNKNKAQIFPLIDTGALFRAFTFRVKRMK